MTREEICNSMTLQDAIQVFRDTNAYGTMDIAKSVILKALEQKTGHWVLSGGFWRCSECKEKALLKLDRATGGYREYEQIRSKYCPECGIKMSEARK